MNFKRVVMILLAALLLPGLALAQASPSQATFNVTKDFTDDNPASVWVTLNCFTGLPLNQFQEISESQGVVFVVTDFESGSLDCEVTEDEFAGYDAEYDCSYDDVSDGEAIDCDITNSPTPVEVTVNKDWEVTGEGGDSLDGCYELTLFCEGEIIGGDPPPGVYGTWTKDLLEYYYGCDEEPSDASYTAAVVPDWQFGTYCWVEEEVYDSSVEVDDTDCSYDFGGLDVEIAGIGGENECTIVNTVFYEGIPTLSQYGMAIMALLMLGVGFVGFRRFV